MIKVWIVNDNDNDDNTDKCKTRVPCFNFPKFQFTTRAPNAQRGVAAMNLLEKRTARDF